MNEYLNNIINNPNSSQEAINLAKAWLELEWLGGIPIRYKDVPQILSPNWEQEALSQSL